MKPLIIGEAPGKHGDPTKPCEGRVGARLAACAGLTFAEYLETFDRVNLLDEQPQDAPKGMAFNVKLAVRKARMLEWSQIPERPFVLILGKRAGAAFGFTNIEYFQLVRINTVDAFVVPHPSGASRWWNVLENELQMIRFMRGVVRGLAK